MLRVYCDFNDGTADGRYWILIVDRQPLEDVAEQFGLRHGDRVLLYQDEDDFTVEADLLFGQTDEWFAGEKICARPDWSTRIG